MKLHEAIEEAVERNAFFRPVGAKGGYSSFHVDPKDGMVKRFTILPDMYYFTNRSYVLTGDWEVIDLEQIEEENKEDYFYWEASG